MIAELNKDGCYHLPSGKRLKSGDRITIKEPFQDLRLSGLLRYDSRLDSYYLESPSGSFLSGMFDDCIDVLEVDGITI